MCRATERAEGVEERKKLRVEREETAAAELEEKDAAFEMHLATRGPRRAGELCACNVQPCAWAKMVRCAVCKEIKKTRCRKSACQALAITLEPPAEVTDAPAALLTAAQ